MTPTLKDEINRKCFEAMDYLIARFANGQITVDQFDTGVDVVWMCCSGLVSEGLVDLVTLTDDEIKKHRAEVKL